MTPTTQPVPRLNTPRDRLAVDRPSATSAGVGAETRTLHGVKAGEPIIHRDGYGGETVWFVDRVTDTQILFNGGLSGISLRYSKDGGRKIGGSGWRRSCVEIATPERLEAVRKKAKHSRLASAFQHRNWHNVTLEKLEQIEALLARAPDSAQGVAGGKE